MNLSLYSSLSDEYKNNKPVADFFVQDAVKIMS
ncbi:hypothetical protein M947_10800 [Sulfurimonas hongkongensis]|uniref:Uncharacterized protein n=1 Tax=Sulfurimonas hongkongensis TaxID=1172190 RepID=T0JCB8_9BACT|nr:hypothetical protein M947_10800 [Sulfurimonas hongkongensis]